MVIDEFCEFACLFNPFIPARMALILTFSLREKELRSDHVWIDGD